MKLLIHYNVKTTLIYRVSAFLLKKEKNNYLLIEYSQEGQFLPWVTCNCPKMFMTFPVIPFHITLKMLSKS